MRTGLKMYEDFLDKHKEQIEKQKPRRESISNETFQTIKLRDAALVENKTELAKTTKTKNTYIHK